MTDAKTMEQESVADDSDLIDEDPPPDGWVPVGLLGDLCHSPANPDYSLCYVQDLGVRRARDAWAHHHGWPGLARHAEEKSVDGGDE